MKHKLRLSRFGVPLIWIAGSITLMILFIYYVYADISLKNIISNINTQDDSSSNSAIREWKKKEQEWKNEIFETDKDSSSKSDGDSSERESINEIDKSEINNFGQCKSLKESSATINTGRNYKDFDFNAGWIKNKGIWNEKFETKFKDSLNDKNRPPLHVIVLPHSHNDPGWLKTFETYFEDSTKHILNSAVKKLPELQDMTFIWTEICFLNLWWEKATVEQQQTLVDLINKGRIEITTGGWVMTDEASAHIYAILDQLIEGHQWVKTNLNFTPTSSWSIDPFGHGSTVPYLLGTSDFEGAIIQRIHYNWKEFLAARQYGDFIWKPFWDTPNSQQHSLLTHNMPFDMYFVDSSCGPHIDKCKPYDFRWFGNIHSNELQSKADQLIQEYARSASLYPHNVFLAIVGGDFRYDSEREFDMQYNYKKIIDYVNANGERYNNTKMQFGTPKDYFKLIHQRYHDFPTLVGDFFPYGDVFNAKPSYWSGYYTTRPFIKILCRELEHNLRNSEILYTLALNKAHQHENNLISKELEDIYGSIINARRNLGLFQHHDAITGTSKSKVMKNYLDRLFVSMKEAISVQELTVKHLLQLHNNMSSLPTLEEIHVREISNEVPKLKNINVQQQSNFKIVLFNSLAQERVDVIKVHVSAPNVKVTDNEGNEIAHQVNPVFKSTPDVVKLEDEHEVLFIVKLSPLSLTTFHIIYVESIATETIASYELIDITVGKDLFIENSRMRLTIDSLTGFVKMLTNIDNEEKLPLIMSFGAYNTSISNSGAYLFKADPDNPEIRNVFQNDNARKIILIKGKIASYVRVYYGTLLSHTIRITNSKSHIDEAIFIQNNINLEERHTNSEMFMRIKTSIMNGGEEPEFFTDLNGFQWQRRSKVWKIGVEGNYYPITTTVFIQDDRMRATLVTSHAQGATSRLAGEFEVMLDRRTSVDDDRGVGEGVMDNVPTQQQYWLTLEYLREKKLQSDQYNVPTFHVHHLSNMLNYPVNLFTMNFNDHDEDDNNSEIFKKVQLLAHPFPCDLHLFNLRTLTSSNHKSLPSRSSLLIVHRLNYDCNFEIYENHFYSDMCQKNSEYFNSTAIFNNVDVNSVQSTSLTALKSHGFIKSFRANPIEAMEFKTFNVTFL